MKGKSILMIMLWALAMALGLGFAASSMAADPPNLLTNGDFEGNDPPNYECGNVGDQFVQSNFQVNVPSTHDRWLDRVNMECEYYPEADGFYAEQQRDDDEGDTDLLFQGFPVEGTCAVDGTDVTVCFDYLNQWPGTGSPPNDNDQTVRPHMGLLGFYSGTGKLNYFACPCPTGDAGFPYTNDWQLYGGSVLNQVKPSYTNTWATSCFTATLGDDYEALAFAWAAGYQGGAAKPNAYQVALDNVRVFVSKFDAMVDVDPNTLDVYSKEKWMTIYMLLPDCFDPMEVDTVKIKGLKLDDDWKYVGLEREKCEVQKAGSGGKFEGEDGYMLMCKFDRQAVIAKVLEQAGSYEYDKFEDLKLIIKGYMYGSEVKFKGSDTIRAKLEKD